MCTESTFQRCIDYVDIAGELRTIYQGCRALTFALSRLSCFSLSLSAVNDGMFIENLVIFVVCDVVSQFHF